MQCNQERYFPARESRFQTRDDYIVTALTQETTYNLTIDPDLHFTQDKEEARWDYYREDPFLNIFHMTLHKVIYRKVGMSTAVIEQS